MVDVDNALKTVDNFARYKDVKSSLIMGPKEIRPKVSICIPTYKRVDTLKETVGSCLNQVNFDDFVVIVADNNPERNDETEQYIHSLNSSKILYYKHEQNIGMYGNLNRLYELSQSEYTVCVHDDDILFPHFLEICFGIISSNSQIDFLYPDKVVWKPNLYEKPCEYIPSKALLYRMSLWDFIVDNPCPPSGFISRTSSMLKIGGYDYSTYPSNDYYFNVKSLANSTVYKLSCGLYIYRMGANTTVKKETILGFMRVDPPLNRWIISKQKFLSVFYHCFILDYSLYWVNFFRINYPNEDLIDVDPDIITNSCRLRRKELSVFKKLFCLIRNVRHRLNGKIIKII